MNEYPVRVGWTDKEGNKFDGYATIRGDSFEEARERLFQEGLKEGIRYGFIGLFEIEWVDLKDIESN